MYETGFCMFHNSCRLNVQWRTFGRFNIRNILEKQVQPTYLDQATQSEILWHGVATYNYVTTAESLFYMLKIKLMQYNILLIKNIPGI